MDQRLEQWRPVVGYEGSYEVSSYGRIRTVERKAKVAQGFRTVPAKLLRPRPHHGGYHCITFCVGNVRQYQTYHRAVAQAFIPNPLDLPEVNHINGDKKDNRVENLEWCTRRQNLAHASISGLLQTGENHHQAVHTRDQALLVTGALLCGVPHSQITHSLGVSRSLVEAISSGQSRYLQPTNGWQSRHAHYQHCQQVMG